MYVGYWAEKTDDEFPVAVANTATDEQIEKMLEEIENFKLRSISVHTKGISRCRLCGCQNGSIEYMFVKRGKSVHLPEGITHYIQEHRVLVPTVLNLRSIMKSIK